MMSCTDKKLLTKLVNDSLNKAESVWETHKGKLLPVHDCKDGVTLSKEPVASQIPGFPFVQENKDKVATFIALVADMRNSSKHLLCEISKKTAKVSMLQRVYYETSALLPALAFTISKNNGSVTEYLGDGVLAFFKVDEQNVKKSIYEAKDAAKECLDYCLETINTELEKRYRLPKLEIGIGLAYGEALVTLVGTDGAKQAKVFGECVFRATKISGGINKIYIDAKLEAKWPKSKKGKLKFEQKNIREVKAFLYPR
jgi:class 3 adenylate cyclase